MLTPIILVLGLMAATAVIASWSDNLGKKLGKKRVTLFGLRPKQTATLITITSSMPIMLFTLGALLLVHRPLRVALLRYDSERHRFDIAREESLTARADEKKARFNEAKARADEQKARENAQAQSLKAQAASREAVSKSRIAENAGRKAEQALKSTRGAEKRAREAQQREREALLRLSSARAGEQQARQGEQSARNREASAREAENQALGRLASAQSRLHLARTKLASAQTRLASAQSQLSLKQAQLASAQTQLASAQVGLQRVRGQRDRVAKQRDEQGKDILLLEARAAELTTQIEGLQAEVRQSRAAIQFATVELDSVRTALVDVQTTPTLVPAGETLAEAIIPSRQSPSEIDKALDSLLAQARVQVRRLGEPLRKLNMSIAFAEKIETLDDGSTLKTDESTQRSFLTSELLKRDAPFSVRVVAARSHTTSETRIEVGLRAVEVRTAFTRGQVLAAANINGRESDARIFKQLLELANKGQSTAEERGVQPPLARDVPFYGPLTNERIFEALRKIRALQGRALVRIVAIDDLLTSSPLRVQFDVDPAASTIQST